MALTHNEAHIIMEEEALPDKVWFLETKTLLDKAWVGMGRKTLTTKTLCLYERWDLALYLCFSKKGRQVGGQVGKVM